MKDSDVGELSKEERQFIVKDIIKQLYDSFKKDQMLYKFFTDDELIYLKNIIQNDIVWVLLINSVASTKKFNHENTEFRGMDIDTYMKKINVYKKYADELSKFSETPITIEFPLHPIHYAVSLKETLERFCKDKQIKNLCWDIYSDKTGIKQIRKTTKVIQFMKSYNIDDRFEAQQSYYQYTTKKI